MPPCKTGDGVRVLGLCDGTHAAPRRRGPALWLAAALGFGASCADLTRPPPHRVRAAALAYVAPPAPTVAAAPSLALDPTAPPSAAPTTDSEPEQIGASHILVAYQGATRAKTTVTRTRDEARTLAKQLSDKAHEAGSDFARLARESSDGPTGIEGGALPKFRRQQMVKPFSDAAFTLKLGQVSDVVETNFGFHIIKRTE